jgi:hypothetical protein
MGDATTNWSRKGKGGSEETARHGLPHLAVHGVGPRLGDHCQWQLGRGIHGAKQNVGQAAPRLHAAVWSPQHSCSLALVHVDSAGAHHHQDQLLRHRRDRREQLPLQQRQCHVDAVAPFAPARPFPSSIFRDKNRRDTGKSQSIWTDSKMETAGSLQRGPETHR